MKRKDMALELAKRTNCALQVVDHPEGWVIRLEWWVPGQGYAGGGWHLHTERGAVKIYKSLDTAVVEAVGILEDAGRPLVVEVHVLPNDAENETWAETG